MITHICMYTIYIRMYMVYVYLCLHHTSNVHTLHIYNAYVHIWNTYTNVSIPFMFSYIYGVHVHMYAPYL